jgi:hypothetical protein
MTLKQQIEATIAAYQEACKYKNLNYKYCIKNRLDCGICNYSNYMCLYDLLRKIQFDESIKGFYLCETPDKIYFNFIFFKKLRLYRAHQTRLQYLRNLLTSLTNDSDN